MIEVFSFEQCSPEWYAARLGLPTASEFHTVLAKGKNGGASLTRKTYLNKLAGEIITGEPAESYSNPFMERGKQMEVEARELYAFITDANLEQVGFVKNGNVGCSPDSLIGSDGALEIKTKTAHLLIDLLRKDEFPPEHEAQCQGVLWVTGREWIDIACYWPKLPLFVKRAYRNEGYIANLAGAVKQFTDELAQTVEMVRTYGNPEARSAGLKKQLQGILDAG